MKMFTLLNRHLPRNPGEAPRYSAGHRAFTSEADAVRERDAMRRQNLPFTCVVVEFEAPEGFYTEE